MALNETALRAAGLPASLISLLVSITKAADRATFAANRAAAANDLAPQLAAAVQAIETLGLAPGMGEAIADIAARLRAVENATDFIPEPILERLAAAEAAIAGMPDEYDDAPLRDLIAALTGRVNALEEAATSGPLPQVALAVTPAAGVAQDAAIGSTVATITTDATSTTLGGTDASLLQISGTNVVTKAALTGKTGLSFTVNGTRSGYTSRQVSVNVAVGATGVMVGGLAIGTVGATGTLYEGYALSDGDDFDATTAADFLTPMNADGAYMTTRHYGVQSGAPKYLRGAASLGGYEADPWHSGFADAGRGVVPASFADTITFDGGVLKAKSRRATAQERAIMGPLSDKMNLSAMVHMGRRNMMRAPCIMEMKLRFPMALSAWNQWHPTFWLLQSQPGNGWDGMELDCEGFDPALRFYMHRWNNGSAAYGPLIANTAPVSQTEYMTFGFEVLQIDGAWTARLWQDGNLVGSSVAGAWFDPSRPFHLMLTNHILQNNLNQSIFDAAGDGGATMECDWWRAWRPAGGKFRKPAVEAAVYKTDFNTPFSFALPTPQAVWGSDVTADVIEMIPNEDNTPAEPWVRGLLPPSVTRTGNTLAGTISDHPGRLVLARSATPAAGDGCVPQPITIAVGPDVRLIDTAIQTGDSVSIDVYAAADCGDLHMGKVVTVGGLAGSGLSYDASTGLITGTAVDGAHTITVGVTNSLGQSASKTITLTVAEGSTEPEPEPALNYTAWTGPGWFDASDASSITLDAGNVAQFANKRGGPSLVSGGVATAIKHVAAARNGLSAIRLTRQTGSASTIPRLEAASTDPVSAMFHGEDRPYTIIAAYMPTDTNTGYVWASSHARSTAETEQIALIRRTANCSIRRQLVQTASNDVNFPGQAANAPRIVAVKHTGTVATVWDTSLTKAVDSAAQDTAAFPVEHRFALFATRNTNDQTFALVQSSMDFYEIVVENAARTDAEIQKAMQDIAAKWGITLA